MTSRRAAELPLWNADLLLSDYNGHLMPGSMVWVWLTTDLAPLDFAAVISVSLLLQLAIDLLMLVLLLGLHLPVGLQHTLDAAAAALGGSAP